MLANITRVRARKKMMLCHSSDVPSAKEICNLPLRLFSPLLCLGAHICPWERANKTEAVYKIKENKIKVLFFIKTISEK